MAEPLVSIIIPSYNQARYLEDTLRTVFFQDYAHLEVLVVDGGSTDGSLEIIRKYASRLDWWVSEPDKAPAATWLPGLTRTICIMLPRLSGTPWNYWKPTRMPGWSMGMASWWIRH